MFVHPLSFPCGAPRHHAVGRRGLRRVGRKCHALAARAGLYAGAVLMASAASVAAQHPHIYPPLPSSQTPHGYHAPCTPCPPQFAPYYAPAPGELRAAPDAIDQDLRAPQRPGQDSGDLPQPESFTPSAQNFDAAPAPTFSSASGATGTPAAPGSAAPTMLGDSFGVCSTFVAGSGFSNVSIPLCPGGRAFKISSNQSPLPQDRVFLNYQFFNDALEVSKSPGFSGLPVINTSKSFDVSRYTLGAERSFGYGASSLQVQVPIIDSLASTTDGFLASPTSELPGVTDTELGNISLAYKRLFYEACTWSASAGLAVDLPTGEDILIRRSVPSLGNPAGGDTLQVENEAVILSPFLGVVAAPNERWFGQGFVQLAIPTGGNSFRYESVDHFLGLGAPPATVTAAGELDVQTLLYVDVSVGFWAYRNDRGDGLLRGIAPLAEMHYTTTLEDSDEVLLSDPTFGPAFGNTLGSLGNTANRQDFLNATLGLSVLLGDTAIRPAFVLPLRDGHDDPFDYEFLVQINRFF